MSSTQTTALVIILLYMAATVAIGLIASRIKQSKEQKQSNDDFLMASKSLGPVVLAGTLFAANTGGASTTGIATNVYIWTFCMLVRNCCGNRICPCIFYCTIF